METITSSFVTACGTMATDLLTAVASIVPVVFPVLAAIIGVGLCIRIIHKVVG